MDDSSSAASTGTLGITPEEFAQESSQELLYTVPMGLWETLPPMTITYTGQEDYLHRIISLEESVQRLAREVERIRDLLKDGFSIDLGDLL